MVIFTDCFSFLDLKKQLKKDLIKKTIYCDRWIVRTKVVRLIKTSFVAHSLF